ncbi:MAG TPA: 3'-5' exonuclease [Burkholderiaceae bacterium]|nr:3'-5' exonuclease [Burkholderiaceae bacterium]
MTPILVFDIETVPDVAGLRRLRPAWGALPDIEIAQRAFDERRERTGSDFLPLHLHRVVAISCAFRDDQGFRVRSIGNADDDEGRLIQSFFATVERHSPQLVSWNGGGFDLPVLHYRGLMHGVQAGRYWELGDEDRDFRYNNYINRYHLRHLDLMDVLAMYQPRASVPLDDLARLCGFAGKLGMDGSKVWEAFQAGGIEQIRHYCETDVVNTYLVYTRFQRMRAIFDAAGCEAEERLVRDTLVALDQPHWREYLAAWGPC